jgi:hypothetical protein
MSKQREALKLALDTLRGWIGIDEWIWPVTAKETCKKNSMEVIAAIREALAEPEQKPVGIVRTVGGYPDDSTHTVEWLVKHKELRDGDKLYTSPAAFTPLTDERIDAAWRSVDYTQSYENFRIAIARAIERAHGIGEP